jgi:hypothetical protein
MGKQLKFLEKCKDHCEVFLQETSNSCHYSCLRCKEHGFIKWLSRDQHWELSEIMYPSYGERIDDIL